MTYERAKIITSLMLVEGMTDEALRSFLDYFGDSIYDDPQKTTEELAFLKNEYPEIEVPEPFMMDVMIVKADAVIGKAHSKGIEVTDPDPSDPGQEGAVYCFSYGDCACRKTVPVRTIADFMKYRDLI
ncbi:MAG: hypothetical protein LKJ83_01470 [Eubacteriaceae bacterium]|jgi:hypothetical protein|nr:hypothetical protein [Eubacteriaceae bacterium]